MRRWNGVAIAALAVLSSAGAEMPAAQQATFAITHVAVIDTTGTPTRADMTVVIAGNRISHVGPTAGIAIPAGVEQLDGRGKFLIPGLWDMHFHWYHAPTLPVFVANGVTGARVMWGFPIHHQWRKEIDAGTLVGPRLVIGSAVIDGAPPVFGRRTAVGTASEARAAVAEARETSADFIKIYQKLSREAYFAIAIQANQSGLAFVGHVPSSISVEEASRAGQKSIEHETAFKSFSTREEELGRAFDTVYASTPLRQPTADDLRPLLRLAVDSYSRERVVTVSAELKKHETWVCPTLTAFRPMWMIAERSFRADPRIKYLPRPLKERFAAFANETRTVEDIRLWRRYYEQHSDSVRLMNDGGVPLLAGTDGGEPYSFPAFGLHDELRLFVEAGLTPLQALQTATLNPARFFAREKDFGTVAVGTLADLVLLDADPLAAIANTTKIHAVVANGRVFQRRDLDRLLANVEAAARQ
jgi:Amidohydrolase family